MKSNVGECLKQYNQSNTMTVKGLVFRTILATLMASDGLLNNNLASLIPSMLISPIGSLLLDMSMNGVSIMNSGFKNMLTTNIGNFKFYQSILLFILVILITIIGGILFGGISSYYYKNLTLPSIEMTKRSQKDGIYSSLAIAIFCAMALPIAYSKKDISTLIAIAIGTSLLPPIANIGVTIGTYQVQPEAYSEKENPIHNSAKYGTLIFLINAVAITIGASLYFKKQCINNNFRKTMKFQPDLF